MKKERESKIQQKMQEDEADQQRQQQEKKEYEVKKQQDFEDLLSGKKKEEMNLQDLFKEYYSKVKSVDTKEFVNKATTSLNSFSAKLEARR